MRRSRNAELPKSLIAVRWWLRALPAPRGAGGSHAGGVVVKAAEEQGLLVFLGLLSPRSPLIHSVHVVCHMQAACSEPFASKPACATFFYPPAAGVSNYGPARSAGQNGLYRLLIDEMMFYLKYLP